MVSNLKTSDVVKSVKVVKHYDSADQALDSISEKLALRQLEIQAKDGKSAEDINQLLAEKNKSKEQQKIYKKFFDEDEE